MRMRMLPPQPLGMEAVSEGLMSKMSESRPKGTEAWHGRRCGRMALATALQFGVTGCPTGTEFDSIMLTRRDRGMVAVAIMLDVAFHSGSDSVVSAAEIAERTGTARRSLEPLLQGLSRVGLLESTKGPHGGYRLGRPPRVIKLSDVIALALSSLEDGSPNLTGRLQRAVVDPLWAEFDAMLQERLEGLTVEDLLRMAAKAGLRKRVTEPLNFAI